MKRLRIFAQKPVGFTVKRLQDSAQVWRLCGTLGIQLLNTDRSEGAADNMLVRHSFSEGGRCGEICFA
jgi:hypothetical protein